MSPLGAVEAKAVELAGNWQRFNSFMAGRQLTELAMGHQWAVVYTSNRDADYITRSNHEIMTRELAPFLRHGRDIEEAGSSHWACGRVDGFLVRVYTPCGRMTRAFQALATMLVAIEDYPMLDEGHASEEEEREASETWERCFRPAERIAHLRRYVSPTDNNDGHSYGYGSFAGLLRAVRMGDTGAPYGDNGYYPLAGGCLA